MFCPTLDVVCQVESKSKTKDHTCNLNSDLGVGGVGLTTYSSSMHNTMAKICKERME